MQCAISKITAMEIQANNTFALLTPYQSVSVYSSTILLQIFGVILNILFISVAPKDKNKQTNTSLCVLCGVQIAQAVVTLAVSTFLFISGEKGQHSVGLVILGKFFKSILLIFKYKFIYVCYIKI